MEITAAVRNNAAADQETDPCFDWTRRQTSSIFLFAAPTKALHESSERH